MTARQRLLARIDRALGGRRLVYFGTRGADAEPLLALPQFEYVFSQIAPLDAMGVGEMCIETLIGRRVDLDMYDIDADTHHSEAIRKMRAQLLRVFEKPGVVMAYRPCALLASAWFPRCEQVRYAGLFHEKQRALEHKAWVETELGRRGIPVIPWEYFADNEIRMIQERASVEKVVLRVNRTDGGAGVRLIEKPEHLGENWPAHTDGFLGVAPFMEPNIPLNVNACLFADGTVSFHGPSVQLIGIPEATSRRFGYCGNDFGAVGELDGPVLLELEEMVKAVGKWLHENGYRGAFGVDALVYENRVYLTEVNPRFQGSSVVASFIDRELERPDVFLAHLAAFLGLEFPREAHLSLSDLARRQPARAHLVKHNGSAVRTSRETPAPDAFPERCRLVPRSGIEIDPEAIILQVIFDKSITSDGHDIPEIIRRNIEQLGEQIAPDLFTATAAT